MKRLSRFKKESSAKVLLTHCWRKLDFKIALTIFCLRSVQTWISKTVHTNHPLGGFLFLVFLNVMTAYLYHIENKKNYLGFARSMDHGCFHSVSTIIRKVQTLASTKNQICIQSLSNNSLSYRILIFVEIIWFLSLLIKQRFSTEILRTQ